MSRRSPEERLSAARAALERGEHRRAARELERARIDLLAEGNLSGLSELLALARELPTRTPWEARLCERLLYEAQQNIAFLTRRAALQAGKGRRDSSALAPLAAAATQASPRVPRRRKIKRGLAIAALAMLALAIADLWLAFLLWIVVAIIVCVRLLWKRDRLEAALLLQTVVVPVEAIAFCIVDFVQSPPFSGVPDPRWVNAVARIGAALWAAGLVAVIVVRRLRGGRASILVPVGCLAAFLIALAVGATAFGPVATPAPLPEERKELAKLGLIAYERGNDIWVMRADGTGAHAISSGRGENTSPVWSPDGTRLAFVRSRQNKPYEIVIVAIGGRKTRRLATIEGGIDPTWSPDGRHIAFVQERGKTNVAIEIAAASNGNVERTLSRGAGDYLAPAWSPDGSWIAFVRSGDLVVAHPNSGTPRVLVRGRAGLDLSDLAWSPDGDRIAFVAQNYEEPGEVDSVTLDGERTRLATESHLNRFTQNPTWSPDGESVLFTTWYAWELGSEFAIVKARADGGETDFLVNLGGYDAWPTWSQDGSWIAFVSARDTNENGQDLYVMRASGEDVRRLTFTPAITENDPAWQPRPS